MTERGKLLLGAVRRNFELLAELERISPADVDQILAAMISHVRNWKPAALSTMDTNPFTKAEL